MKKWLSYTELNSFLWLISTHPGLWWIYKYWKHIFNQNIHVFSVRYAVRLDNFCDLGLYIGVRWAFHSCFRFRLYPAHFQTFESNHNDCRFLCLFLSGLWHLPPCFVACGCALWPYLPAYSAGHLLQCSRGVSQGACSPLDCCCCAGVALWQPPLLALVGHETGSGSYHRPEVGFTWTGFATRQGTPQGLSPAWCAKPVRPVAWASALGGL